MRKVSGHGSLSDAATSTSTKRANETVDKQLRRLASNVAKLKGSRRNQWETEWSDISARAFEEYSKRLEPWRQEFETVPHQNLNAEDEAIYQALKLKFEQVDSAALSRSYLWELSQLTDLSASVVGDARDWRITKADQAKEVAQFYRSVPARFAEKMANLNEGLAEGYVAPKVIVQHTIDQLKEAMGPSTDKSIFLQGLQSLPADLPAKERRAAIQGVRRAYEEALRPALENYVLYLQDVVLPQARGDDAVGLACLPHGREAYDEIVELQTTKALSAEQVHALGLKEVARLERALKPLLRRLAPEAKSVPEALRQVAELDVQKAPSTDAYVAAAREDVRRAEEALPKLFGFKDGEVPPVEVIPSTDPSVGVASYTSSVHGYIVPTLTPEALGSLASTSFHEYTHHLQLGTQRPKHEAPKLVSRSWSSSTLEGGALYGEDVSRTHGLFESDLEKVGNLGSELFRAVRLVVDTGLHHDGWTRDQAIAYMRENTQLSEGEIALEVDRYISWPGQALTYKVGELDILRMQKKARRALGDAFVESEFNHLIVVGSGESLPVMERRVEDWIAQKRATLATP